MPKTLATATVDRLLHHAHVCVTSGDSVRLAQATTGKGVLPLLSLPAVPPPAPALLSAPALLPAAQEARRG